MDSELVQWLNGYIKQVESLLGIISTCRQGDFEGFLGALGEEEEYYLKYDLYKYARLMPPFTVSMNTLEKDDPNTGNDLQQGNFCVKKSSIQLSALLSDQGFPQSYPKAKSKHCQLVGDIATRSTLNALKLRDGILLHCEGNPFISPTSLKTLQRMTSWMLIGKGTKPSRSPLRTECSPTHPCQFGIQCKS